MKNKFLTLSRFTVAALAGIGFASLLAQPSLAEPSQTYNLPNYDPQNNTADPYNNENNPFSNNGNDSGLGVFDLIHRATLGVGNLDVEAQNQQLNNEANAFLRKRQQLLQQGQQQQTPGYQINTPGVVAPLPQSGQ